MAGLVKRETTVVRPAGYTDPLVVFGRIDRAFERMFDMWPTFLLLRGPVATARHGLTASLDTGQRVLPGRIGCDPVRPLASTPTRTST